MPALAGAETRLERFIDRTPAVPRGGSTNSSGGLSQSARTSAPDRSRCAARTIAQAFRPRSQPMKVVAASAGNHAQGCRAQPPHCQWMPRSSCRKAHLAEDRGDPGVRRRRALQRDDCGRRLLQVATEFYKPPAQVDPSVRSPRMSSPDRRPSVTEIAEQHPEARTVVVHGRRRPARRSPSGLPVHGPGRARGRNPSGAGRLLPAIP